MSQVFVVMTNDYPAAVFSDQEKAEKFCEEKNTDQRENATHTGVRWSSYAFRLDDTSRADSFHNSWMQSNRKREENKDA